MAANEAQLIEYAHFGGYKATDQAARALLAEFGEGDVLHRRSRCKKQKPSILILKMSVTDVKIHRRLLPLYEALQRAGYCVEPYLGLNTSNEGYILQFGVGSCDIYFPLGTHVEISENGKHGQNAAKYRVWVCNRRYILLPKWHEHVAFDEYFNAEDVRESRYLIFVFDNDAAVPRCLALMGDLADAELALLNPAVRRVSVLLGLMRRRDLSKPNGARLSKDVRALVGRALLVAEMERAKEEVAGWR